jgi:hypothetical protein
MIKQEVVIPGPTAAGVHCMDVTSTGATSPTVAVAELPADDAVIVTVLSDAIAPALILKFVDVAPAGTVAELGTVNPPPLDATATGEPPFNAGLDIVTVQVPFVFGPIDAGEH